MPVLANDLIEAGLSNVEILVEQKLPLTSRRINAVLAGVHPVTKKNSYVLIELKQWSEADLYEENQELVLIGAYGGRPVSVLAVSEPWKSIPPLLERTYGFVFAARNTRHRQGLSDSK